MARFDCYGCEIAWEPCDNPECENGDVLDENENLMECPKCRGTGGFYLGEPMSESDYERELRREDAAHFATTYPETA